MKSFSLSLFQVCIAWKFSLKSFRSLLILNQYRNYESLSCVKCQTKICPMPVWTTPHLPPCVGMWDQKLGRLVLQLAQTLHIFSWQLRSIRKKKLKTHRKPSKTSTPQCHETQQRCWWSLMALSPNKSSLQCGEKLPLPSQDHACESQRIQACPAASRYPNNILHPTSRYQPFPAHPERKNQLNASGFQSSAIHPIQVILWNHPSTFRQLPKGLGSAKIPLRDAQHLLQAPPPVPDKCGTGSRP